MAEFTAEQLVGIARAQALPASARLIRDWVDLGLLDRPRKRGLGRGRGTTAVWDENQKDLLLVLLGHRRDEGASVPALCNVPVSLWLLWGDAYAPVRQVRRALTTWGRSARASSLARAELVARDALGRLGEDSASRAHKMRFRELIADIQAGSPIDEDLLRRFARAAIDPPSGAARGPDGAPLSGDIYVDGVMALDRGLDSLPDVSTAVLEEARRRYRWSREVYAQDQPRLARDPDLGHLFPAPTFQDLAANACRDLLLIVGLLLVEQDSERGAREAGMG